MALRDQPYLPLYVQDIMTDEKLNECSAATHGIYIKGIMCLMHKSETYGKILLKQKHKQTDNKEKNFASLLAKHLPYSEEEICRAITELIAEGVCHYEEDFLVQKRMVKDNLLSEIRANAGKSGGQKTQKNHKKFAKAKSKANTEYESDNENENSSINKENISFENFWSLYDKKVGEIGKIKLKWLNLSEDEKLKAIAHIPKYKAAQPEKKFRKDPSTYLNNKSFNDEIIYSNGNGTTINGNFQNIKRTSRNDAGQIGALNDIKSEAGFN